MRILLAVDGSPCSDVALAEVASRPWPAGSEFMVVTAHELPLMLPEAWAISPEYCDRLQDAVREQAQVVADTARLKLNKTLGESVVTSKIVAGSPRSAILELAESWKADLIIVGSHGYRGWERFLLGSVSQAVVSHAKCSVEVVRCKRNRAEEPAAA
jgi:nucleotide-binding universal stress UspA family protein